MEPTQPHIFHIHVDAQLMPQKLDEYVIRQLHFLPTDYDGHPDGYDHFEPKRHLTYKAITKEEFKSQWQQLLKKVEEFPDFVGYIEGEYLPIDEYLPFKPYVDIPVPFHITKRKLNSENKEDFRQTEIHITMERIGSHPDLIKKLLDSGLYGAFISKKDGEFLVLTMQGYIKDIEPLIESVRTFLLNSGGAYRCTIKEERAIDNRLYNINSSELPEIAEAIVYLPTMPSRRLLV